VTDQFEQIQRAFFGCYRIQREFGRNGWLTFLAKDFKRRKVVLRVTRPESSFPVEHFLREMPRIAQLDHPHIVPLLDAGLTEEFLYYVVPHVGHNSLRQRLEQQKQLRIDDAVRITRQVADALGYAHNRGIIHGDIKPENILLRRGHAQVDHFWSMAMLPMEMRVGVAVGTPAYMSPEQAADTSTANHRSDVYSLGCVLYEMLAGVPPLVASTVQALFQKLSAEPPPPVRRLRSDVPPVLEAALDRVLQKRPADRFASALEFAEALAS